MKKTAKPAEGIAASKLAATKRALVEWDSKPKGSEERFQAFKKVIATLDHAK